MSTLKVKIWNTIVGYLHWDKNNATALFEPDEEYLKAPFNISPILHKKNKGIIYGNTFPDFFKGLPPYFYDSLPDYFGNRIFNEWLVQNDMDQVDLNPVEQLMYIGQRGVGALEYFPGKEIPNLVHNIDFKELAEISNLIIKNKYNYQNYLENPRALQNMLQIGSSVGGAQAKLLIAIDSKGVIKAGDIIHNDPHTNYYIVKLANEIDTAWGQEKNCVEYVYNEMARGAGIKVAESSLIKEGGCLHFLTKRYDRVENQKIHTQTLNALTGFYSRTKTFSYEDAFTYMEMLQLDYKDKEHFYLQMVFNIAAFNIDDHTKNFSFIMNKKGEWSLAPAYDLTFPVDPYLPSFDNHKLSINGKRNNINRADLLHLAKVVGIRNANKLIDQVLTEVSGFKERAKHQQISVKTIELIDKRLQAINKSLLK